MAACMCVSVCVTPRFIVGLLWICCDLDALCLYLFVLHRLKGQHIYTYIYICMYVWGSCGNNELVADGLAVCICCVQTRGFVLLSPGEDRAFLLASGFLSVGATRKNICGMQRVRARGGKERERN